MYSIISIYANRDLRSQTRSMSRRQDTITFHFYLYFQIILGFRFTHCYVGRLVPKINFLICQGLKAMYYNMYEFQQIVFSPPTHLEIRNTQILKYSEKHQILSPKFASQEIPGCKITPFQRFCSGTWGTCRLSLSCLLFHIIKTGFFVRSDQPPTQFTFMLQNIFSLIAPPDSFHLSCLVEKLP